MSETQTVPQESIATEAISLWRLRFEMDDGRMISHFVAIDAGEKVIATHALRVHQPDWIGLSFMPLVHALLKTKAKLSCILVSLSTQ